MRILRTFCVGGARTQSRPVSKCSEHAGEGQADRRVNSLSLYRSPICAFFPKPRRHRRDLRADASRFRGPPAQRADRGYINDALRRAGALTLSLVAHEDRQVGHAAFSPVTIGDGSADWCGLGLGRAARHAGQGRGRGADPRGPGAAAGAGRGGLRGDGDPAYYRRFGFETRPDLRYPGVPPEYFMALVTRGRPAATWLSRGLRGARAATGGAARGGVQGGRPPGRRSRRPQRIEVFSMASRACRSRASSISRVTSSG